MIQDQLDSSQLTRQRYDTLICGSIFFLYMIHDVGISPTMNMKSRRHDSSEISNA